MPLKFSLLRRQSEHSPAILLKYYAKQFLASVQICILFIIVYMSLKDFKKC